MTLSENLVKAIGNSPETPELSMLYKKGSEIKIYAKQPGKGYKKISNSELLKLLAGLKVEALSKTERPKIKNVIRIFTNPLDKPKGPLSKISRAVSSLISCAKNALCLKGFHTTRYLDAKRAEGLLRSFQSVKEASTVHVLLEQTGTPTPKRLAEVEEELAEADRITDEYDKSYALKGLSVKLAEAGHFDKALEATGKISDNITKSSALKGLSVKLAEAGHFDKALEAAGKMPSEWAKSSALKDISAKLVEKLGYDKAREVVDRVPDEEIKSRVLEEVNLLKKH